MKSLSSLLSVVLIFSCLSIQAPVVILSNPPVEIDEQNDKPSYEAHWAGMDIGSTILMNADFGTDFSGDTWLTIHGGKMILLTPQPYHLIYLSISCLFLSNI
jgi:hypothetical protein